ncbi:MAG: AAA family ATPase [Steroidobacteraceae bacterium]|nr:AAA family ATPase [Steroidobacteraceae bacterium]
MYTSHFGLSEKPFAITPDPRYLYMSGRHAEALAHLLYGINEAGGFVQLTGEVGTGKTTVVRTLLARVPPHVDVAVILNPRVTPAEFLQSICEELGVSVLEAERSSIKYLVDVLNRRLLSAHAAGRRVILIVDEAQNLSAEVLEHVRLLTNLETPTQKLLQVLLIGQPELRELLDRTELRQLAQRVTGRYHLSPLSRDETRHYVRHRLRVAGASTEIFTEAALGEVHRLSSGIPRVINVCCDRALLGAYAQETPRITAALVRRAAAEVYGRRFAPGWIGWLAVGIAGIGFCAVLFAGWRTWGGPTGRPREVAAAQPVRVAASTALARNATRIIAPHAAKPVVAMAAPKKPPPPSSKPPGASVADLLAAMPPDDGGIAAWRGLLALWGVRLVDARDPCRQAARAGLACLAQSGSWAEVRALDRPAILTLIGGHGHVHHVLLAGLGKHHARLVIGSKPHVVRLDELSRDWFGQFTVIWRPKTARVRELAQGMRGNAVRWLRRSLNALRGTADDPARGDVYDHNLTLAVEDFQRAHRLAVDGIAGIQTQIVLDAALGGPNSPVLTPLAKRRG